MTHSSLLAWRTPWTEEPGGKQSWSHRESDTTERLSTQHIPLGFPAGSVVKNLPAIQEAWVQLGCQGPLGEEMASHSSVLAWEIPRTEKPGGLQPVGSQKSRTDLWRHNNMHRHILEPETQE